MTVEQFAVERKLRIGEQHRQFRPRQAQIAFAPFGDGHFVGQKFHGAIELAAHFERLHQALLKTEVFKAATLRERESERLLIVVAQDELRHLVGHLGKQCVARLHA